jgi:hypothetical protein
MNTTLRGPMGQKAPKQRGTALEKRYYRWLHQNCCCVLTGYHPFEIAHTGGLAEGKGTSRKAWIETCLPLRKQLHEAEERRRAAFWANVGFPDYLAWAERLYDIFEADSDPADLLMDMQERANRDEITSILWGKI